jgi:hypothetical protein
LLFICPYVAGKSHRRLGRVRELIIDLILARLRREQRRVQRRAGGTYHGSSGGLGSNTKTKLLATALGVAAAAVMAPAALFALHIRAGIALQRSPRSFLMLGASGRS